MFKPSTRPLISERAARFASWGVCLGCCDGIRGWSVFVGRRTSASFSKEGQVIWYALCFAVDCYFSEARITTRSGDGSRLGEMRGVNGWQGTPRGKELSGKYNLQSRGSAVSCTLSQQQETTYHFPKHL